MKDLLNNELEIGNLVIMAMPGYADICIGKIYAFTAQKVRVEFINDWNYKKGMRDNKLVDSTSLYRLSGEDATIYALKQGL